MSKRNNSKILIISGWYATDTPRNYKTYGSETIRGNELRQLWLSCVEEFLSAEYILYTDSNSPIQMDSTGSTHAIQKTLALDLNPGHPQSTELHYCGWCASAIMGLEYALFCDYDYVIYVEQDCLVYGEELLRILLESVEKTGISFGSGKGTPQYMQQSLFILKKDYIRQFLGRLHNINAKDSEISPEDKFHLATCALLPRLGLTMIIKIENLFKSRKLRLISAACRRIKFLLFAFTRVYSFLPINYGRSRPLNFNDKAFYFQHASSAEIDAFKSLIKNR
jgi:hypothetical protein